MPENFISLKCQSCGGKLDVYPDMERFACGYCGTEMIVQRRGGTVALKLVEEAIKKVQVGTDKTAAEVVTLTPKSSHSVFSQIGRGVLYAFGGVAAVLLCIGLFIGSKHVGTAGSSNPQNSNNEVPSLDEPKPPVEKAKAKAGPSPVQKAKTKATPPEQEDLDAQIERLNREAFPPAERTGTIGTQARNTDLERQNVETKARMGHDRAEVAAKAARKQAAIDKKDAVSALGLVALYESNEVNADTLAKGHLIVVEGTIDRIAKDIFNHPYVTVGRSKHGITSIQCAFSKEDEPQLAALIPGQHIYLKGTVKGKMMNVLMDGCKLLNVK